MSKRSVPDFSMPDEPGPTLNLRGTGRGPTGASIAVGDIVEDCLLVAELGFGSSGHAFLAREIPLADRPIVLKVAAENRAEEMNLARLQHTHIMPLFWARTHYPLAVRVLAMPYLAKTTLADLLRLLEASPIATWTGLRAFEALQEDQDGLPLRIVAQEPSAHILKHSSWVDFVVRMGHALAEALAYTHQRDLLHLDIKPANIVVTPDGEPILLDLDVARPPMTAGATAAPGLGGTPAFMSPEQRGAMHALCRGQPIPLSIDGRSDLYSLGLVLYHALGGARDADRCPDARCLLRRNPNVPRWLAEILAHCLAENPADRYSDGHALAADLDRYLHVQAPHGASRRQTRFVQEPGHALLPAIWKNGRSHHHGKQEYRLPHLPLVRNPG